MNGPVKFLVWCLIVGGGFGAWSAFHGNKSKPAGSSVSQAAPTPPAKSPEAAASPSPSPSPSSAAEPATGATINNQFGFAFIYNQPSIDAQKLGTLSSGTPVTVISHQPGWALIKVETSTGWVPDSAISEGQQQ